MGADCSCPCGTDEKLVLDNSASLPILRIGEGTLSLSSKHQQHVVLDNPLRCLQSPPTEAHSSTERNDGMVAAVGGGITTDVLPGLQFERRETVDTSSSATSSRHTECSSTNTTLLAAAVIRPGEVPDCLKGNVGPHHPKHERRRGSSSSSCGGVAASPRTPQYHMLISRPSGEESDDRDPLSALRSSSQRAGGSRDGINAARLGADDDCSLKHQPYLVEDAIGEPGRLGVQSAARAGDHQSNDAVDDSAALPSSLRRGDRKIGSLRMPPDRGLFLPASMYSSSNRFQPSFATPRRVSASSLRDDCDGAIPTTTVADHMNVVVVSTVHPTKPIAPPPTHRHSLSGATTTTDGGDHNTHSDAEDASNPFGEQVPTSQSLLLALSTTLNLRTSAKINSKMIVVPNQPFFFFASSLLHFFFPFEKFGFCRCFYFCLWIPLHCILFSDCVERQV